jgi:hypothetical protein
MVYTGLDRSPEMLKIALKYFPNDNWVLGDAETFSIYADVIACSDVLIHQHDIEPLIKNMWNNTDKILIFTMNCSEDHEYARTRDGPFVFDGGLIMKRVTSKNVIKIIDKLDGLHDFNEFVIDSNTSIFRVNRI